MKTDGVALAIDLRGRRAHFEGESSFAVAFHPDRDDEVVLQIRNETAAPQKIALRDLPPWLRPAGGDSVEVAAGTAGTIRLVVVGAVAARATSLFIAQPLAASFVLDAGDERREVSVTATLGREALARRQRKRLALAAVVFVLAAVHSTWALTTRQARADALALRGAKTTAVVTDLTPRNHNQMYYAYEVNGVRYERNDFARGESVGDRIGVTYLPEAPDVSVIRDDYEHVGVRGYEAAPLPVLTIALILLVISTLNPTATRGRRGR